MNKLAPENFLELFASCLPEQGQLITLDTSFEKLTGWDSMARLSLISAIDGDFGLDLTAAELRECRKLEDLYRVLKKKSSC